VRPPAIAKKIAIARPRSATSAPEPVGVAPQRAEATAKTITPITTMRRWPAMSAKRPPKAKSADSESR
jgi:hypothetical protein